MPSGPAFTPAASAMHRCADGQEIPPIPFRLPLPGSFCDLDHFQPAAGDFDATVGVDGAFGVDTAFVVDGAFAFGAAVDAPVDTAITANGTRTTARIIFNRTGMLTTPLRARC